MLNPTAAPASCPHHAVAAPTAPGPEDRLVFPQHQRVIAQYLDNEAGERALFLFYGDREISFDEPELFAFGETLARQARFTAGDATRWGDGYAWEQVQPLLAMLLDDGILAPEDPAAAVCPMAAGDRPSPLPPARGTQPRSWRDCAAITEELTGHAIDIAYLELVVPVFRIAHMSLDAEGRQVGEANVFPQALRLDVPTRWRTCIYPGSRYLDERPMNVSALKSMRQHWPQMMAVLRQLRAAYLRRFPAAATGWTVGDVECLSTLVLALPTYLLMRPAAALADGELHPVLSGLFRVSDGLRMTTHQMLFVPVAEATWSPHSPVTSAEVYAYAERNHAFASTHGVCAGPQAMIEEFLAVLIDGQVPRGAPAEVTLAPAVEAALAEVEAAFDYGLLGLQAHAVLFSQWPLMTRTYAQLADIAAHCPTPDAAPWQALNQHLQQNLSLLQNQSLHASEAWRRNREQVYQAIDAHCAQGLRRPGEPVQAPLPERVARVPSDRAPLQASLRTILRGRLGADAAAAASVDALVDCLCAYLERTRGLLCVVLQVQDRINQLLARPQPNQPFSAADIDVHVLLQENEARRLPHLLDALAPLLGFAAQITAVGVTFTPTPVATIQSAQPRLRVPPEFAGAGLADTRATCTIS